EDVLVLFVRHGRVWLQLKGVDVDPGVVVHLAELFVLIHGNREAPILQRFRPRLHSLLLLGRQWLASAAPLSPALRSETGSAAGTTGTTGSATCSSTGSTTRSTASAAGSA